MECTRAPATLALMLLAGSLAPGQASAFDCASVQAYADGSGYAAGNLVKRGGNAYRCTVGGWCTIGGPYAPGDGWAWVNSWDDLGACDVSDPPSAGDRAAPDGGSGGGGQPPNPDGSGFPAIVSESQFEQMFPGRDGFYTYQGLVEAASTFPAFANTGSQTVRRQEAAAALANFSHETGGLVYIEEIARNEYCSGSETPCGVCAPGKRYYGRGPTQLSWNYNYCAAGRALGLDLWDNPEQMAENPTTAWRTALWFWMRQTGAGNRTAHAAMTDGSGFGETIRTINGALECDGGNPGQVQSRIGIYQNFTQILGTPSGANLGC